MSDREATELLVALHWCVENGYDLPGVLHACASVGIERNEDTRQMLVDFVRAKMSGNEQKEPRA